MSKLALYNAIATRLQEQLNSLENTATFGSCDYIARYRNQFRGGDETIPVRAIGIQFASIVYTEKTKGVQEGKAEIHIHVHCKSLARQRQGSQHKDESELSLIYQQEVNKALHGWNGLQRRSEQDDVDYEFGLEDVLVYECTFEDRTADRRREHEEVTVTLEVVAEKNLPDAPHEDTYSPEV